MTDLKKIKQELELSAEEAVRVIAQAASEAAKVVASAASEAVKVVNVKGANDHDLLIELKTRMEGLKTDIEGIKNGTAVQISDHETRINCLEELKTKQATLITLGMGLLVIIAGMLIYHLFGISI